MLAGWLSAFRNRVYLGWLGFAFISFAGFLLAADRAKAAQGLGLADPRMVLLAKALLFVCALAFLLALIAAVQETRRRLRQLQERHREAAEAMLEMFQAAREKEEAEKADEPDTDEPWRGDG